MTAKTAALIATLREAFGKMETFPVAYHGRLAAILDKAPNEALLAAAEAGIKFVSPLARNRCITRGLIKIEAPAQWTPETARRQIGGTFGT